MSARVMALSTRSADLHGDVVLGTGALNFFDVDFVAGPPLQLSSGHVANDGVWGSEMARSRRCVCALRSSLKRPWMLATTKSKRSSTSSA
jgi:hypothetical protein